jgi:hypothetical protein
MMHVQVEAIEAITPRQGDRAAVAWLAIIIMFIPPLLLPLLCSVPCASLRRPVVSHIVSSPRPVTLRLYLVYVAE